MKYTGDKLHPRTVHEGPQGGEEREMHSSTLSLTSALDDFGWSTPTPVVHMHMSKSNCMLYADNNIGIPVTIFAELMQFTRTVCRCLVGK
jgi:hypothetical protein